MIKVSKSLPDVAVIRGGKANFKESLSRGAEVLSSLKQIGYRPIDVVISPNGEWTAQGIPTDGHHIFSRSRTIVDITKERKEKHHELARNMGIKLLFSYDNDLGLDRENIYRVLRQQGIKVPGTYVIRSSKPLKDDLLRDLWLKFHTPLMVRPLERRDDVPSKLIKLFPDLEETVRDYHERGIDIQILTYHKVPTSSIAVLPDFRGERLYIPLWVETFSSIKELPNEKSIVKPYLQAPQFRKEQIKAFITKVYNALGLSDIACIDIIPHKDDFIVVNVDTQPSFKKDSRFMKSLESTGATLGQYIHTHINK